MRYAGLLKNDFVNGQGVCVSYWAQGCPIRCLGCHNPQTWDFNGGIEKNINDIAQEILEAIPANGIQRNFSILGGEPLCDENLSITKFLIYSVKQKFPNIKIFLWSGYTWEYLLSKAEKNQELKYILDNLDMMVTGPFILAKRDITLPYRGSRNQKVLWKGKDF